MKRLKVGVVGVGNLGAAYGFAVVENRLVDELVLIDLNYELALAHAADLSLSVGKSLAIPIYAGHWRDIEDADLIVISAGITSREGTDKMVLARKNIVAFKAIFAKLFLSDFSGIIGVATDPVDMLTAAALKYSGLPREQVLGLGTVIASDCLARQLGELLKIDSSLISSPVVGGSAFVIPLWSQTVIGGQPLARYLERAECDPQQLNACFVDSQQMVQDIIRGKGNLCYAAVAGLLQISRSLLNDKHPPLTVSAFLAGEYGCHGVSLAVPAVVRAKEAKIVELDLDENEQETLSAAAHCFAENAVEFADLF